MGLTDSCPVALAVVAALSATSVAVLVASTPPRIKSSSRSTAPSPEAV